MQTTISRTICHIGFPIKWFSEMGEIYKMVKYDIAQITVY